MKTSRCASESSVRNAFSSFGWMIGATSRRNCRYCSGNLATRSLRSARESWGWPAGASASSARAIAKARINGQLSRIVPAYRLCLSLAHLHVHLAPFRAGLHAVGGVDAEDVLRAELVLDLAVHAQQIRGLLD